jgi:hypothetical protein
MPTRSLATPPSWPPPTLRCSPRQLRAGPYPQRTPHKTALAATAGSNVDIMARTSGSRGCASLSAAVTFSPARTSIIDVSS